MATKPKKNPAPRGRGKLVPVPAASTRREKSSLVTVARKLEEQRRERKRERDRAYRARKKKEKLAGEDTAPNRAAGGKFAPKSRFLIAPTDDDDLTTLEAALKEQGLERGFDYDFPIDRVESEEEWLARNE